jgi:L-aspartate oxidase
VTVSGDFLIIGSGVAGLRAALGLADAGRVLVLTKADAQESNTGYAQGGIAVAIGGDDSPALHAEDTMAAGDRLCDPAAVRVLVEDGPRYVQQLVEWGARFDRDEHGRLALGREAAHSVRRVLHARDATGREIGRVLWERVAADPRIEVLEDAQAVSLLTRDGACVGATFVTHDGERHRAEAACTLLATGGAGQVFRETTNPPVATGDGIAMAFEAGARVADLEFVQFHPTVLHVHGAPRFLLSEALRGEGGALLNDDRERFVSRYEPAGDLASRDLVARAIVREMDRTGGPVYLSMAHLDAEYVRRRFPTIAAACAKVGLDLATDPIPISPAAHYVMGGVQTDLDARTSIAGLFAAGEVACTGVHGANRLASNSLLEGLVFGARAAEAMRRSSAPAQWAVPAEPLAAAMPGIFREAGPASSGRRTSGPRSEDIRDVMWHHVGLVRTGSGLRDAVDRLAEWRCALVDDPEGPRDLARVRTAHLVTVGLLIAHAALRREESRGGHFRADFPARDDERWRRHVADVW